MYTTGFLGQMNAMTTGIGNWFRAGALALGLSSFGMAGCSGESFPDGHIPPLDQPDPGDTTIPNTPQANLDACLPADTAGVRFRVLVEASGGRVGTGTALPLGQFRMAMPSDSLTIVNGGDGSIQVRGRLKWDSVPKEFADLDPSQASGPIALLTQARLDGQPLTNSSMTAPGLTGPWANQFPGFTDANRVGFSWPVEGTLTYDRTGGQVSNCALDLTLRTNARTTSGEGPSLDYFLLALNAPRADGTPYMASANYAGETVVPLVGAANVVLDTNATWDTICDGDCVGVTGSSVTSVRARLLRNAAMAAHADGGADASHDAGHDAAHDAGAADAGHSDGGAGGDAGIHDSGSGG